MLEAVEESVFCLLEVIEMMRCILLCMLEVAEVVCFVLEAVEVVLGSLEVLKVMRWMRRMLLPMPEAVEVAHLLLEAVNNMLHVLEMLEACAVCYFYMLEVVEGVCCVPERHARCSPFAGGAGDALCCSEYRRPWRAYAMCWARWRLCFMCLRRWKCSLRATLYAGSRRRECVLFAGGN